MNSSPPHCCTISATTPVNSAPIRRTTPKTIIMTRRARDVLEPFFPPVIVECVRLHVAAKRYLCATDPTYFGKLSSASVHTLSLQGGPMSEAEVAEFESNPLASRSCPRPHLGRRR